MVLEGAPFGSSARPLGTEAGLSELTALCEEMHVTRSRDLEYLDGTLRLQGVLCGEVEAEKRPGVVVFHDALGLGRHAIERAQMLAALGYVALAADLYGNRVQPRDTDHALELLMSLRNSPAKWRARAAAALEALSAVPGVDRTRLGAIGFCFGGSTALELARAGASLSAVVCFHGGLDTALSAQRGVVAGSILVCTGSDDSRVPLSQIPVFLDEMTSAGVDCQVLVHSGTQHSFTNPATNGFPGMAYSARADRRSWAAMRAFLEETIGPNGRVHYET